MDYGQHLAIVNFIWNIADDVLRDVYVRGKYRDVILPMTVLRRLDAVLEPTKQAVIAMKKRLDDAKITNQDAALKQAAGQAFYNSSQFTLRDLKSKNSQQRLRADFEDYLNGFSKNVQDILENFEFRNQIPRLTKADALGFLIEKFMEDSINLSPNPIFNVDGAVKLPGLDNHAMGTIFEELVRRFNEENNEEAGEHWTPRDAVKLMANLLFLPVVDKIESGTYLVYDGACGTGGMLTVAEQTLQRLAQSHNKEVSIHLYGQEINPETYAICKADLLLKGDGEEADNIVGGSDRSTLLHDAFGSKKFDFMISNPPYGKSWKKDLEEMGGKAGLTDPRFVVCHDNDPDFKLISRADDGQMMFLVNKLSKMKHDTSLGSRIAEVHNGSSLFTGDAGQGENNVRRWIIENDWLEAIIALPAAMFYNTDIATYIWVISNKKSPHRVGKIQLIDATSFACPLRRNLGKKNCELSEESIARITSLFLDFKQNDYSKIFPNEFFGYWKVIVERPLRLTVSLSKERIHSLDEKLTSKSEKALVRCIEGYCQSFGAGPYNDFNQFFDSLEKRASSAGIRITAKHRKLLIELLTDKNEQAEPVIRRVLNAEQGQYSRVFGDFEQVKDGVTRRVEFESDPELRDTEQIGLLEDGGIERFFQEEVLPASSDAWVSRDGMSKGYDLHVERFFKQYHEERSSEMLLKEVVRVENKARGLLRELTELTSAETAFVEVGNARTE